MLRLTENLMSLIITDWLTREVNKDDARGGVQRTGLTQSHALTPVKHVSSPQRKRTHQMATRSTQCPVAFSLHTALSPATRRWSALPARPAMAASLSHSHTPLLSSPSRTSRPHNSRGDPLSPSRPAALFSSPSISFPFRSLSIL